MAANTRYHRVPEDCRSMDSSTRNEDLDVLLTGPDANGSEDQPPRNEHRFACHPTFFFRLISVCVFLPSFVLLIIGHRQASIPAIVFVSFALVRNFLVVLHHIFSKHVRLHLEFRNRSPRTRKCSKSWLGWLKHGRLHLLLDMVLLAILFITAILGSRASSRYRWYNGERTPEAAAGCILAFVGILAYAISVPDLGKPSNITASGGVSFNYAKSKQVNRPEQPQVYRDIEARGEVSIQPRKTGADSPVVVSG
ncbi:hypothetical protein F5882DRAFT_420917 [Hyaloscypha sp. PMI_1271]|nr:hypothetical protein F5882DRAFT_420917 [Hyaloscypha sp. PMI_1271]